MSVIVIVNQASQWMKLSLDANGIYIHWGQSSGGALGSPQSPEAKQKIMPLACGGDLNCAWRNGEIEELYKECKCLQARMTGSCPSMARVCQIVAGLRGMPSSFLVGLGSNGASLAIAVAVCGNRKEE